MKPDLSSQRQPCGQSNLLVKLSTHVCFLFSVPLEYVAWHPGLNLALVRRAQTTHANAQQMHNSIRWAAVTSLTDGKRRRYDVTANKWSSMNLTSFYINS